jgi:hypothetical protein
MKSLVAACILGMCIIVSLSLLAGYLIGVQPLASVVTYVTASSLAGGFAIFYKSYRQGHDNDSF